jgi:hypothetical protein
VLFQTHHKRWREDATKPTWTSGGPGLLEEGLIRKGADVGGGKSLLLLYYTT